MDGTVKADVRIPAYDALAGANAQLATSGGASVGLTSASALAARSRALVRIPRSVSRSSSESWRRPEPLRGRRLLPRKLDCFLGPPPAAIDQPSGRVHAWVQRGHQVARRPGTGIG
jgi:hypothetical protein